MLFVREYPILIALLALAQGSILKDEKKKLLHHKRAIDPYSYPVPAISFNDAPGKSKVNVETIRSVSPAGFQPSKGYAGSTQTNFQGTTGGSVSYNAFEPDTSKKFTSSSGSSSGTTGNNVKAIGGYGGSSYQGNEGFSSSVSSGQPGTTFSGFQQTSFAGSSSFPGAGSTANALGSTGKNNGYGGYSSQVTKKPTNTGQQQSGSRPDVAGFSGFQQNSGSFGTGGPTNLGGAGIGGVGGGIGGASVGGVGGGIGGAGIGGVGGGIGGTSVGGVGGGIGGAGIGGAGIAGVGGVTGGSSGGTGGQGGMMGASFMSTCYPAATWTLQDMAEPP